MPRASEPDLAHIDQLLAGAGLRHGRRKLMAAGFDRQLESLAAELEKSVRSQFAPRASATP
jgi:hypothetical protein